MFLVQEVLILLQADGSAKADLVPVNLYNM